jgi:hypothetical protein
MTTTTIANKERVKELLEFIFQSPHFSHQMSADLSRDEFDRLEEVQDELGQLRLLIDLGEEYDDLDDLDWAIIEIQSSL